jgi:hypothetical protein
MDAHGFDDLTRSFARGLTRRHVLRGLGGGLIATLGLARTPAAAQQTKQSLCHATGDPANPWVVITIAEPAWPTHFAHGDTPYVDCCADAECGADQQCRDGACVDVCLALEAPCSSTDECCQDVPMVCGALQKSGGPPACCLPLGQQTSDLAQCCRGPEFLTVHLGSDGACGGEGAVCVSNLTCASSVCCEFACCAAGETCTATGCAAA